MGLGLARIAGALSGPDDPLRPSSCWTRPDSAAGAAQGAAPSAAPSAASSAIPEAGARAAAIFQPVQTETMLDAALRNAGDRPVMLDFYADGCVACKNMARRTLRAPQIAPPAFGRGVTAPLCRRTSRPGGAGGADRPRGAAHRCGPDIPAPRWPGDGPGHWRRETAQLRCHRPVAS